MTLPGQSLIKMPIGRCVICMNRHLHGNPLTPPSPLRGEDQGEGLFSMNPFKKIFLLFTFLFLYLLVNISTGDEQGQHAMHGDTTSVATSKTGEGPVINEYVIPTPYSHP